LVSRWKPANVRKKGTSTASTGRLMSCLFLLGGGLLILYLLFRLLITA
jgi:hypothetical protein